MSPKHSLKVTQKIESICGLGCSEVNQLLDKAEHGNKLEELSEFSNTEISEIIDELSKIMSVYGIDVDKQE